ncbi:YraN family protein [Nocardiopsis sp. MG754419]|uniref:YraN family protein n=1 Tax=Nocardiopsis sp. MG754419 TaxID=2259865 RepID=UPI001BA65B18|nr:YraN family protein [Nocardiopsis sp. MG754419]MBR8745337.1 YraN family protein [Nocardiopsis sp. MG754419]
MRRWAEYRNALGRSGEELAARYLERVGMRVLARNWRAPNGAGEIDIVARDGPVLVIAEVKTRGSLRHGHPLEAITARKRRRLRLLGRSWARAHRRRPFPLRIDGVCVLFDRGRVLLAHERGLR